jgi:DNA-binding GntR family transcriptional regulator
LTPLIFQFQYQLIAQQIRERISRGDLAPGARLDSERALCRQFDVQRNTIRQALELLEKERHISIEGRRGSFVLHPAAITGGTLLVLSD